MSCLLILMTACGTDQGGSKSTASKEVKFDLPQIRERGILRGITTYSATSYFIYRGRPMGYEYELLNRLADHLGLELEIVIARNLDSLFAMLRRGDGDIIAHGLTITQERKEKVAFALPHTTTQQVLVQKKPDNWRDMKLHEIENELIRNPIKLIGKEVYVRHNSAYYQRLINLSEEVGGDIIIKLAPGDMTTEDLIRMVNDGEIKYTIADQNIAAINKTYYPDLDIRTSISLPQRIAWAVRKSSPLLLEAINSWLSEVRGTTEYNVIYNKYFENKHAFKRRVKSDFFSISSGRISPYDDLIKKYADLIGWDWRLLASMIYQESQFEPDSDSWAGAKGLMQIMPATAEHFGVEEIGDPEDNIRAGTAYIKYLQNLWNEIPDSMDRIKFTLASYNVGENHVADARRLAEKYGADPDVWDGNVAEYLLKKSKEEFFNDEVVRYGYCRGREPYDYVNEILYRYNHYARALNLQNEPGSISESATRSPQD